MITADQIAGTWVSDHDMHPMTNIWGRTYWFPGPDGGFMGEYRGYWPTITGEKPGGVFWHFHGKVEA